ncbi:hypothetical protein K502DRAFT_352915 [Neoconidiobolus thromboides FSU 785]|nr:hypothetical protein K502DRAFT_352915 [Neoconidiobolus thromboides FSU 785]
MNYLFIAVSLLSAISINSLPVDTANANDVSPATVTNANRGSTTNGQPSSVQAKTFEPFNLFSGFGNFLPGGTSVHKLIHS